MRFAVVVNEGSGSVPAGGEDTLCKIVSAAGHSFATRTDPNWSLDDRVDAAIRSDADAIIVWGGDGTTACVLSRSGPEGVPVLALPGGTMNLLHKRLHNGSTDWQEILERVLRASTTRSISAGHMPAGRFYLAAFLGRLTGLAQSREAMREGRILEAATTLVSNGVFDLNDPVRLTTKGRNGSNDLDAVAAAIVIDDNQTARFAIATMDPASPWDLATTAIDATINGWREAQSIDHGATNEVLVTVAPGATVPATLDGEQVSFDRSASIRLISRAANVLVAGQA